MGKYLGQYFKFNNSFNQVRKELVQLMIDHDKIEQELMNIFSNFVKYFRRCCVIRITTPIVGRC
jgi:signal transduction histidine kinase